MWWCVCEYVVVGRSGWEGRAAPPTSPIPVLGPSPCVHPPALNPLYVGGGEWEGVVVVLVNVYVMHRRRGSAPLHVRTPTEDSVLEDQVARGHAALRMRKRTKGLRVTAQRLMLPASFSVMNARLMLSELPHCILQIKELACPSPRSDAV